MGFHRWRTKGKTWSKLKTRSREFRQDQTGAEERLWSRLRGRQLAGMKFRRQHAIGPFVVDFYCPEKKLVIEVDGPIHDGQADEDKYREQELRTRGFRVLRLRNENLLGDLDNVIAKIEAAFAAI
jgi:very-short-patch-repair endonuclease